MRTRRQFNRIWHRVRTETDSSSLRKLTRMLRSRNGDARLAALFRVRKQMSTTRLKGYFTLGKSCMTDRDNDCRWQATIIVGEYIHLFPDKVWKVIAKFGRSSDRDMRVAVSSILLEHLLEQRFKQFFQRVKREAFRSRTFADTLSKSGSFIRGKRNRQQFQEALHQLNN